MESKLLIIGEVFVDTHLDIVFENNPLVRLGGIFHAARACDALNIKYFLAYYCPPYLKPDVEQFSCLLNTQGCYELGYINRAPNIMLINESKEIACQGYYNPLKDQAEFIETNNIKQIIDRVQPTDILICPGRYDTKKLVRDLKNCFARIHIDFHYDSQDLIENIETTIETVILSTSSGLFKEGCLGTFDGVKDFFRQCPSVNNFLLKENRGGSCYYQVEADVLYEAPAFYVPTKHSVGVGDCYNAVIISEKFFPNNISKRMRLASYCAAKYAETMDHNSFKNNLGQIINDLEKAISVEGIRLSWEERKIKNIYLAAPDFPEIDTSLLDQLSNSLRYHNFNPRLPIRENGLADKNCSPEEIIKIYEKDIQLLDLCDLLIAVLLYDDPGTLVELGMFKGQGKPTIIFDPYMICRNIFVKHSPDHLCHTISDVLDATYQCLKR